MKKFRSIFLSVVLTCLTVLMLVGCGKKISADDLVGTWTEYDTSGHGFDITYEFHSDGTMSTYIGGQHFSDGTYTVDNNKINYTLTAPNGSVSSDSWGVELGYESIIITSSNGNEGTFYKQ